MAELSTGFDQYLSGPPGSLSPSLGHEAIYQLSAVSWSASSFLQAIVIAFLVTPLALVFAFLAKRASHKRRKDRTILWALPLAFLVLGSLVAFFPIFMGNRPGTSASPLV